jgi:malonyl-CoA/methylmalonyl-CoA synthetase
MPDPEYRRGLQMTQAPATRDPWQWLLFHARQRPERPFLETSDRRRWSYADMEALARRLAGALLQLQVAPGDRVVAQIEKSPEAVALYLACLQLGAAFVPLNTAYTFAELEYFLGDAAPTLAVVRPAQREQVMSIAARCGVKQVETMDEHGGGTLLALARHPADPSNAAAWQPDSLAALLYTSGTTGRSKGAMLSRANLSSNAETLGRAWEFTASDVLLHALPIFHVHGLFVAINSVLAAGSSMLFLPKFDADEVIRLLPRATVMMGVPTFYTRLLRHPGLTRALVSHMRLFISGSAPLLAETHCEFQSRTGHAVLERYGMSETLMITSNPYRGERIPGSVGLPLPNIEVRIADPESGAIFEQPDTIGMIEVRGPNVFAGYWRMPEKTAAEFRQDGFFITGDLGKRDARGYIYIVGRGKDLIITGGYNVYPIEVELEIDALPGVNESAVIGVPHPDFGEGVTAVVVLNAGAQVDEATIRRELEQRLARFKVPKRVVFVPELPRNTMGKVQKSVLRERYCDIY